MALFYRFEVESVVILPFGAFLSLEDFGLHAPYQEIIMLVMGPFVNLVLGLIFYILEINELFEINIFIFLFLLVFSICFISNFSSLTFSSNICI